MTPSHRVFDWLLCHPWPKHEVARLLETTVIEATEATAALYWGAPDDEPFTVQAIPNIAPPFQSVFIESACPETWVTREGPAPHPNAGERYGVLISAISRDNFEDLVSRFYAAEIQRRVVVADCAWYMFVELYQEGFTGVAVGDGWPAGCPTPVSYGLIGSGADGRFIQPVTDSDAAGSENDQPTFITVSRSGMFWEPSSPPGEVMSALLAMSLLHCKNVELVERDPYVGVRKSLRKHRRRPLVRYSTINVHSMKAIFDGEGGMAAGGGLVRALSITRGHFKDYRQRGLFGKLKGLYWWNQHARGDVSAGVVNHDYSVKP